MTSPLDLYAAAGRSPDWSYRIAGRLGTALEILLVGIVAGIVAGSSDAVFAISFANLLAGFDRIAGGLVALPRIEPGTVHGMYVDLLAGLLAGLAAWITLVWTGLRRMSIGLALILAGWQLWAIAVMITMVLVNFGRGMELPLALEATRDLVESPSPAGVLFKLTTFVGIWPAAWAVLDLLHGQRFATIFAPEGRLRRGEFGGGLVIAGGFWLLTMALGIGVAGLPERTGLALGSWLSILVPLAILVFFQACGEELIFRGYILQQLAVRWRSPLIWAFLPAFLFGLLHYASGAALGIGWHYVAVTTLFGMTAAALVWRTGSLAAAMGLHTGLNLFSLSAIGVEGVIEGTQIYLYDGSGAVTLFAVDGIATLMVLVFVLSPLCPFRARPAVA